jgi:hypothetical protein
MVLVGTCPGQEQHNEEWLSLNGAAVATRAEQAGKRVAWLHKSGLLAPMAAAARRLGTPEAVRHVLDVSLRDANRAAA